MLRYILTLAGVFLLYGSAQAQQEDLHFRSIFRNAVELFSGKTLDKPSLDKLIYLMPQNSLRDLPSATGSAEDYLQMLNHRFATEKITTKDLYENGVAATPAADDFQLLESRLAESDTMIVIVPGVFGEFIKTYPFSEVLLKDASVFKELWLRKTAAAVDAKDKTDDQAALKNVSDVNSAGISPVPLKDLFLVNSIDFAGQARVKVVLFKTPSMSLETLGDQEELARRFNRRLSKMFRVLGETPKNVVLLGYSRGTAVGLEMLSRAKKEKLPWLGNVKAMVSLGGVVFGSALADNAVINNESNEYKEMQLLKNLATSLKPERRHALGNFAKYFEFASGMIRIMQPQNTSPLKSLREFYTMMERGPMRTDPRAAVSLAILQFKEFGLQLGDFSSDQYEQDIKRFKLFVSAVSTAVEQLSTPSRMAWWKKNILPKAVNYYTVSAAMAEKTSELVNNRLGYNPESPDFNSLSDNWEAFRNINFSSLYRGNYLNDSQVAWQKTHLWPELVTLLNPANSDLKSTHLATLGTHHWGLALKVVNAVSPGQVASGQLLDGNPFPREALLYSIALATVAGKQ